MISIEEAINRIMANTLELPVESVPIEKALNRTLASPEHSPEDHPFFDQTAVDGYGIIFDDTVFDKKFEIVGEIPAGSTAEPIKTHQAIRVFTGASIPKGCDTVVMQERTSVNGNELQINPHKLAAGQNIRRKGEQIQAQEIALDKGCILNPTAIGFLASLGIQNVEVYKVPSAAIIPTGGEFSKGKERKPGEIYQSNGIMLENAFALNGFHSTAQECEDDLEKLTALIRGFSNYDTIILTGGVSVGKYDFTAKALENAGYKIIFHKVAQKPGKPMLFAKKGEKVAFGLPGNPRAVMIAFYFYILPFLQASMGNKAEKSITLPLAESFSVHGDRDLILSGNIIDGKVVPGFGQQSHMLKSLAESDVLLHLKAANKEYKAGEMVDCYLI